MTTLTHNYFGWPTMFPEPGVAQPVHVRVIAGETAVDPEVVTYVESQGGARVVWPDKDGEPDERVILDEVFSMLYDYGYSFTKIERQRRPDLRCWIYYGIGRRFEVAE